MSVLIETSLGDLTIDLYTDRCPKASKNFIKLCEMKYYNNALFETVQKDYLTQIKTKENKSIYEQLQGPDHKYFDDEIYKDKKYNQFGLVGTSNLGPNKNQADFFITLTDTHLKHLDEKHTIFGIIPLEEGKEFFDKMNDLQVDEDGKPYYNIRIKHTIVIDDPFEDIEGMIEPDESPEEVKEADNGRLELHEKIEDFSGRTEEQIIEETKKLRAKTQAIGLEMLKDIADADAAPPENVLFVCKLNQATQESDLELIFSRFGPIKKCEVVRDWKTGQSLQYAFIEFEAETAAKEAYFKMENALIDERRIHVDFCQSVEKLWTKYQKKGQKKKNYSLGQAFDQQANNQPEIKLKDKYDYQSKNKHRYVFDQQHGSQDREREYIEKIKNLKKESYSTSKSRSSSPKKQDKKRQSKSKSRDKDRKKNRQKSNDRKKKKSRSRDRKKKSKSRSRSRERNRKQHKSRSKNRDRKKEKNRSRSRSNQRDQKKKNYRSKSRSYDRHQKKHRR